MPATRMNAGVNFQDRALQGSARQPIASKYMLILSLERFIVSINAPKIEGKMSLVRYETNPFLTDMTVPLKGRQVKISTLSKDSNVLINQTTGEVHGTHLLTYKKVDGEQFIKLFTANIALTFDLSAAGIKTFNVLAWVVQNKAISRDEVVLDSIMLSDFLKAQIKPLNLSLATFKRGLNELEEAQIIAKTMRKSFYFINPNFVFNGDRIAFTTLIERKKENI